MKKITTILLIGSFYALFLFGAHSQTAENNNPPKIDDALRIREETLRTREDALKKREIALKQREKIQKRKEEALKNREQALIKEEEEKNKNKEKGLAKNKQEDDDILKSAKQTETADTNNEAEVVTKTPQPIVDAVMAAGGKYFVLKLKETKGVAIYDAEKKKIVKNLNFSSENFLYTAGGNTLLVYYPENNLLQTWDLKTFQRGKTKPNPKGVAISSMTMGHSNDSRALLRYALGTDELDKTGIFLLDLATMKEVPFKIEPKSRDHSYRSFVQYKANADMSIVTEWARGSTMGLYMLSDKSGKYTFSHRSPSYLAISEDGFIYTESGIIYNSQLTKVAHLRGKRLIPGIGGSLFLGISHDNVIDVYPSGSISSISSAGEFPELDRSRNNHVRRNSWEVTPFDFERRFLFHPENGYLVMIPLSNDQIIHRRFDLKQILAQAGENYLVVTSAPKTTVRIGESWQYKMNTLSNNDKIQYSLELAPKGMKINGDGKLTWKVTGNESNLEQIIVLVENGDGESTFHNFNLMIDPLK